MPPRETMKRSLIRGLKLGFVAGAVFAVAEVVSTAATGGSAFMPIRMFASIVLGESALQASGAGTVAVVGLLAHFALSGFYGVVFGGFHAISELDVRSGPGVYALVGLGYGVTLWFLNFQLLARVLYPWFLDAPQFLQLLLHGALFGLPLGLLWHLGEARAAREEVAHHA